MSRLLIRTPAEASNPRISSASESSRAAASICVTPAYLRSAFPTGQHISSTHRKPSRAAKLTTSPKLQSGKMALTNPSCIPRLLLSFAECEPALFPMRKIPAEYPTGEEMSRIAGSYYGYGTSTGPWNSGPPAAT